MKYARRFMEREEELQSIILFKFVWIVSHCQYIFVVDASKPINVELEYSFQRLHTRRLAEATLQTLGIPLVKINSYKFLTRKVTVYE